MLQGLWRSFNLNNNMEIEWNVPTFFLTQYSKAEPKIKKKNNLKKEK